MKNKIIDFTTSINPLLHGIFISYIPFEIERKSYEIVKFEVKLNADVTGFWSPTEKVIELIEEKIYHYFYITPDEIDWNNSKTVFWFFLQKG